MRRVRLVAAICPTILLAQLTFADAPLYREALYQEALRPQFHFTAKKNWLNDPNGLVYFDGEYHLFFQFNPHGNEWGNMTWGHAVSSDLVHWQQLEDAITPDALGMVYSGSCVVDWQNTAGFQAGDAPAIVAIYTAAGGTSAESAAAKFTQCLAYSNDRGRTWTKYADNPVLPHIVAENRDPKVVWHAPSRRWAMALYLDGNQFAIFSSPDLKAWTRTDTLEVPGSIECPDLFALDVDGQPGATKWIFWTANNRYLVGDFDGETFSPLGEPQQLDFGANRFAAQTYSDIPSEDSRRIQIAWMRGGNYPEMPFNQQMTFPTSLTLHRTKGGYRLHSEPVAEVAALRDEPIRWAGELHDGNNPLGKLHGDMHEIKLAVAPGPAREIVLELHGTRVSYDAESETLHCGATAAQVPLIAGELKLHILLDRTSIEVFANDGAVSLSNCVLPEESAQTYQLYGAGAVVNSLVAWPLRSAWEKREE